MKYQPPFDPALLDPVDGIHNADDDAPYINGDPRIGQEGSIPPAAAFEHPMREIMYVIEEAGLTPDHENLEQLRAAVLWMIEHLVPFAKSGDGIDIYHGGEDSQYFFRSLVAGDNITLTVLTDGTTGRTSIKIDSAGSGGGASGESNTGSNLGTGAKVFKQKTGVDFEHRTIKGGADITVTEGASEITIAYSGSPSVSLADIAPMMMVRQTRLPATISTSLVNSVWTKRPLNDVVINQIAGASFNSGTSQISLPAGTYRVIFNGVAYNAGHHRTRLYDVTGSTTLADSNTGDCYSPDKNAQAAIGVGRFVLSTTSVLELQTYFRGGHSAWMGDNENNAPADYHIDGWVEIVKEA